MALSLRRVCFVKMLPFEDLKSAVPDFIFKMTGTENGNHICVDKYIYIYILGTCRNAEIRKFTIESVKNFSRDFPPNL